MNRALILVLFTSLLLCACSHLQMPQRADRSQSSTDRDVGGPSYSAAAAKVTDMCSLMPADLAQKLVPSGFAPERERFPLRCTVRNGKSALGITIDNGPAAPVKGAEFIPGLAGGGYLERLDPVSRGDAYLTVILGNDGFNWNMHVEVAGHDGKDHKDDAIAVARDILARLR